ncbi:MAG: HAD family phosphatase [Candidatus Kuenenia stuttgartiensis]|nr:HAD family phosphatase [Candidatus Kuenenia stuttgartiensis]MCL4727197.1 HAD family phosphatase [Candidatus Kuenenia stuttgartiensis]MCZ7611833.1 HAD family phosphatase [Ignavibacterium sp.]
MKKYKAVFFDFDGVIGKTMDDNYLAWEYAFSQYDIPIDKNEYFLLEGKNTRGVARHFIGKSTGNYGVVDEIVSLKEKYYLENNRFSFYDGVESLLPKFKGKGYLLGFVSGASYVRLARSLSQEFFKNLDVIITGDKVDNCKPHPEPYLNAAKALSISPTECIVVENAPMGIESAKRAGMFCIAICSTLEKNYLQKADVVIDKFMNLEEIL